MRNPAEYVFILGAGGSGSTLIERALGGHSRLTPMGEMSMMSLQFARNDPRRCCSCGKLPAECPIWGEVAARIRERYGIDVVAAPFGFRVSDIGWEEQRGIREFRHWLLHYGSRVMSFAGRSVGTTRLNGLRGRWAMNRLFVADVIRDLSGASAVIDSSKDYLDMLDLFSAADRPTAALFVTRDVRGVAWSMKKRAMQRGLDTRIGPAVRRWVRVNARSLRMLRSVPPQSWMQVRYEDFCRRPQEMTQRLCDFLGYEYEESIWTSLNRPQHTIGGNKMRFLEMSCVREDDEWGQRLSPAELQEITRLARRTARRIGYDLCDLEACSTAGRLS